VAKTRIVRNVGRPTLAQEAIAIYMQRVSTEIKEDQRQKKLVATGDSLNSHVITINKNNNTLTAANYYPFLIEGRGPGKFPPPDTILDWLTERNITPRDPKMSLKSLAYLIGRKQAREGSAIHRGEREGIDFLEIATKNEGVLYRQVGKAMADQVTDSLLKTFTKNPNYQVL
jgi:hypothetical protein